MDELLAQFLIEGSELAQQASDALMELERRPGERALVDDAFRAVHTLKGSAALFDLPAMTRVLHAAEDALSAVRGGRALDPALTDALLAALAQAERWLAGLDERAAQPAGADDIAMRLAARIRADRAETPAPGEAPRPPPAWAQGLHPADAAGQPMVAIRYRPDPTAFFRGDDPLAVLAGVPGLAALRLSLAPAAPAETYDPFDCRLLLEAAAAAPLEAVQAALRLVSGQVELAVSPAAGQAASAALAEFAGARALRVDASQVEALAALADELVAAKIGLADVAERSAVLGRAGGEARAVAEALAARAGELDRLSGRLRQRVTALRMRPLGPLLRRFHRIAREMAAGVGKAVELGVDDGGLAADTAVIDGLVEPLTHLLRNAVDHGVEPPDRRRALGKPERAALALSARERGGRLVVRLSDDGRGVDPEAMRAAAVRKGLIDPAQAAALSEREAVELIFRPGFSTAESVSDLSGRGVGMDAVRAAVRRLGGRIAVDSRPGEGLSVELSLPFSLALSRVMVVACGGERFGVPMDRVLETVRVTPGQVFPIRGGRAFEWRGRAAPLLSLSSLVGAAAAPADQSAAHRVLVIQAGGEAVGVTVDSIDNRLDLVVRPLDGLLAAMPGLAGAAVLGNGSVLMILDPEALIG